MEKFPIIRDTGGEIVFDGRNIEVFQYWISTHMYIYDYHQSTKQHVFDILDFAAEVHKEQIRKDGSLYINHIVRVILDGDYKLENTSLLFMPRKIMIRAVHDIIEDHPDKWHELYDMIGIDIFRDALALATGGVSLSKRVEMLEFFENLVVDDQNLEIYDDIIRMLNPVDPLYKLMFSGYQKIEKDRERMYYAISLYHDGIISKESHGDTEKDRDMYIALGNYIYFSRENARDKVADMYDNMGDMAEREKQKPGYTKKRRIKAYILGVKLREYRMNDEYNRLESAFHDAGSSMLSDAAVRKLFHELRQTVSSPSVL